MYSYILCEFEYGYEGNFYQEIDNGGNVIRMTDMDGSTLDLYLDIAIPYGAKVINDNPTKPIWAI
jgi:hypothetical protein